MYLRFRLGASLDAGCRAPRHFKRAFSVSLLFSAVLIGSVISYREMLKIFSLGQFSDDAADLWMDEASEIGVAQRVNESFSDVGTSDTEDASEDEEATLIHSDESVVGTPNEQESFSVVGVSETEDEDVVDNNESISSQSSHSMEENHSAEASEPPIFDRLREINVVDLAIRHVEPQSDVTAAVCFKTLFGQIDLGIVIQWAGT
jgi:hypothetical protein